MVLINNVRRFIIITFLRTSAVRKCWCVCVCFVCLLLFFTLTVTTLRHSETIKTNGESYIKFIISKVTSTESKTRKYE